MIVVLPSPTPLTSPPPSTVATEASPVLHENSAASTAWPFTSNAVAASRSVSPGPRVADSGSTSTELAACVTDIVAAPAASPAAAVTSATPGPVAVTSPVESTAATRVSELDHDTGSSGIARPTWSSTSAVNCAVAPSAASVAAAGLTVTVVGTGTSTVTSAAPVTPPDSAVTVAVPPATPVTSPVESTVATSVSLEAHANCAPATAWPFASSASAVSRSVSAVTRLAAPDVMVTVLVACATVISALAVAAPDVAVTVVAPLATAVASPEASTVATAASELDHDTVAPAITRPFWSNTEAVNWTVRPSAARVADDGDNVIVVATGVGGGGAGAVPESPHERPPSRTAAVATAALWCHEVRVIVAQ